MVMGLLPLTVSGQDGAAPPAEPGPMLRAVQARGLLVCGINEDLFGFGFLNPNTGAITGLFVDLCTAIATAVFDDPLAVDYRLLADGTSVDVLLADDTPPDVIFLRSLSLAFTEAVDTRLDFGPTIYFDGQSIMLREGTSNEAWSELEGETICTLAGTPAEYNIRHEIAARDIPVEILTFPALADLREAFNAGRCDAQTLDRILLELQRQSTDVPGDYVVWSTPFTRSGLAPVYQYGDKQWAAIVNWTLRGLIRAEELGLDGENVTDFLRLPDELDVDYINRVGPEVAGMVDPSLGLGGQLGLANDFMVSVLKQVGNYGTIYERHLGPNSTLPISRSLNNLWTNGGILGAPPWR